MFVRWKTASYKAVLLSMALGLLGSTIALAASGDLDLTFSDDGKVIRDFKTSDEIYDIAIQSDEKILAAGMGFSIETKTDFALARYNSDGSQDEIFDNIFTDFGGNEVASDVALQPDGKIVLAGQVCKAPATKGTCDLALARYNPDGTLDTIFSGDGKQTTDFGGGTN